jgi:D-alanyl-D-alanine carboxypeptidase
MDSPTPKRTASRPRRVALGVRRALHVATNVATLVATLVALTACADPGPIANGSIQGSVTDAAGLTVADASVQLSGSAQSTRIASSGANGVYTFADVPAGTYALTISPPDGFATGPTSTKSITVARGALAQASAFVLERLLGGRGSIRGIVRDQSLVPVAGATIELSGNDQPTRSTTSDCDGVYTFIDVPSGTYALTIVPTKDQEVGAPGATSITLVGGVQADATTLALNRTTVESAFVTALRLRLATAAADGSFAGAVHVAYNDQPVFVGACGLADREQRIPNTLDTKFRVGSMNKMLTAVAIMQLVQAGTVELGEPISEYLADYPNADLASKVTIHHLLTHTGGTGDIFGSQFTANRLELRNTEDYLELYGTRALQFEPGAQHVYSNYGFVLLGAIIERMSGLTYDEYVATHILSPAGMTSTGAAPEDVVVPNRSLGYTRPGNVGPWLSNASVLPYRGTSAGGWYSTVGDFSRFAAALKAHQLLDEAHTTLLLSGKIPLGPVVQYAYGFIDRIQVGRRLVGHGGGYSGMNGELSFEPTGGYTFVVLSNLDPPASTTIEFFILTNLPATPPTPLG